MVDLIILKKTIVPYLNFKKGKTKHRINSQEMEQPYELQIAKYNDSEGFYLLYIDEVGNEMSDTYHESIGNALDQAAWEFGLKEEDWRDV